MIITPYGHLAPKEILMSINCIRTLLETAAQKASEKTAIIEKERTISYGELFTKANQIAHYLHGMNLPKGSRIGIYSHKSIEQVIAIYALLSSEYILVPISRLLKPEQVEHIINDCEIACIITDTKKLPAIRAIQFSGTILTYEACDKELVSFEEIYKCCPKSFTCKLYSHENATITYSFGSSGFPNGIVLTHRNLIDSARVVSHYLKIESDDVISGILPFIFDYGLNQLFCALYKQATVALHRLVLPSDFFNHLIQDKVSIIALMPIHISLMFDEEPGHKLPHPELLKRVRTITSSGGKITPKMLQNIKNLYPDAKFYSMHGLTEAFRSTYLDPDQLAIRPQSIGKPIPDVEIFILNEEGNACKPREIGELIQRGGAIYKGFWNAPEATKNRFKSIQILKNVINLEGSLADEIVVASGDYVYADEEGYLYFVDRKDDMIKSCGFRVSPYEIETAAYHNLSGIKECAVFSIPDEATEEAIVLCYSASREIPKNELLFELKKHLPNHMLPSIILYKPRLPLTSPSQGEIDKEALKKEVATIE